ncbi:hypothetical protein [Xenorhabdus bovienii]|uniref:hypothetical protein n=1 Tax=Xenorhabdus bovienii TaxID=40576 RepID=UPI0023B2AC80|nr:hypothetical protein [Xenorhabdus bovienii]MDE9434253.1 hypothetical protein [Xenorhabdus bovienii]MDE9491887.1 hypothetical protein [Xenorhabdus bovienii]MDE9508263.1 hypothetical protein [Xenorhabdus bovienii]MDE9549320.1 hypothetical protein [Xenorhabdus bovienii]
MLSVNGKAVRYDFLAESTGTVILGLAQLASRQPVWKKALSWISRPQLGGNLRDAQSNLRTS